MTEHAPILPIGTRLLRYPRPIKVTPPKVRKLKPTYERLTHIVMAAQAIRESRRPSRAMVPVDKSTTDRIDG